MLVTLDFGLVSLSVRLIDVRLKQTGYVELPEMLAATTKSFMVWCSKEGVLI